MHKQPHIRDSGRKFRFERDVSKQRRLIEASAKFAKTEVRSCGIVCVSPKETLGGVERAFRSSRSSFCNRACRHKHTHSAFFCANTISI